MEFPDSNIPNIDLTIAVPSELLPTLEFLMKHEENFRALRIGDNHGSRKVSFQIIFHKSEFSIFLDPIDHLFCRILVFGKREDVISEGCDKLC